MELPERNIGFLIHDVARLMRKRFEQNARGLGLTRSQWQVVAFLSRNEGIQQGTLAELLRVSVIGWRRRIWSSAGRIRRIGVSGSFTSNPRPIRCSSRFSPLGPPRGRRRLKVWRRTTVTDFSISCRL